MIYADNNPPQNQNTKNSSTRRKIFRIVSVIGPIASIITIFVFVSGSDHLTDFFQKDKAVITLESSAVTDGIPKEISNTEGSSNDEGSTAGESDGVLPNKNKTTVGQTVNRDAQSVALGSTSSSTPSATIPNSNSKAPEITLPKSTYTGSNTAVFARAYFGRESTPAYTNEEVVFVEYIMTGWQSGEIWLHFMDVSTGNDVYYFGPVPSWCKASLITKYSFTDGHYYILYFTDKDGNLVSNSSLVILYKPESPTIFYPQGSPQNLQSYNTSGYNNYGDGDTRYSDYAYYESN
jgi:hypothetical protein